MVQRIVVDSGCDLTDEIKSGSMPHLDMIPLNLQIGDKHYIDDKNLDVTKYIEEMENYDGAVRTAAPSPELYLEAYKKEGSIFAVTLTSKLSGSYNSALVAKQMYLDEIGDKFIHVIDSFSAGVGETIIALKIDECIKNNFTDSEIVATMNKFMSETNIFFILEKFDNLVKNGRMNPYIAKVASFLSIKAICTSDKGNIVMVDKARGYKKAIARLTDMIQKENLNFEDRTLGITHVKCLDRALEIKDEILKKIKCKDVIICEANGLCSTYAQKGGVIVSF